METPPPAEEKKSISRKLDGGGTNSTYLKLDKKLDGIAGRIEQLILNLPGRDNHESIRREIGFHKNLISKEMETQSEEKPEHLCHIAERLKMLEDSLNDWDNGTFLGDHNWLNLGPPCCCTESCLDNAPDSCNEFQEGDSRVEESKADDGSLNGQYDINQVVEVDNTSESRNSWIGRRLAGCVVFLLMVLTGIVVTNFQQAEEFFLVPT